MKNKLVYSLVFLVFVEIIIGCNIKNKQIDKKNSVYYHDKIDSLNFKNLFEFSKGYRCQISFSDSNFILANRGIGTGYFLYNYSLKNKSLSEGYLEIGKGPNEILGPRQVLIHNGYLWINDITLKKILSIKLENAISRKNLQFNEYRFEDKYLMINMIDSSRFYSTGSLNSPFRIQEIDINTEEVINEYSKYENIPRDLPIHAYKYANQFLSYLSTECNRLVMAYLYKDLIEIYDFNSDSLISIRGEDGFDVEYSVEGNKAVFNKKSRSAYIDIYATQKYIYVSYSGQFIMGKPRYAKCIKVFNWDGEMIRSFMFDEKILSFYVSDNDKYLYAYDSETGYIVESKIEGL